VTSRRRRRRLAARLVVCAFVTALGLVGSGSAESAPETDTHPGVQVYAYFYQWFTPSSWNRAKADYPLAGRYSSDDLSVLRDQVSQARAAGITGFLTSWKSTDALNRRLDMLVGVARAEKFNLGIVYEALDFQRHPLPIATVQNDMTFLVSRWGTALKSSGFHKPLIIWTGTDQYSVADIAAVRSALGTNVDLLAAAKNVTDYERVARYVDGDAYYWSSANPASQSTLKKLIAMGAVVHSHHGIWLAPAASGFDGRTLGHTRVIGRDDGRTLVRSLNDAFASSPDAVGVISWNEWSENTYIEPGERYGGRELAVLQRYLGRSTAEAGVAGTMAENRRKASPWTGLDAAVVLAVVCLASVAALGRRARRRTATRRRHARGRTATGRLDADVIR